MRRKNTNNACLQSNYGTHSWKHARLTKKYCMSYLEFYRIVKLVKNFKGSPNSFLSSNPLWPKTVSTPSSKPRGPSEKNLLIKQKPSVKKRSKKTAMWVDSNSSTNTT
jgi:hypothetical protein